MRAYLAAKATAATFTCRRSLSGRAQTLFASVFLVFDPQVSAGAV